MRKPTREWLYRGHSFLVSQVVTKASELIYRAFPPVIQVETTNACNANCVICPRAKMTRRIGFMGEELYQSIIKECALNKIHCLHLHNFGEPLLDRRLAERIKLAKEVGLNRVKIFTNGSLLTEEKSGELIRAGLDEIKISFDGNTKEIFESIRKNLDYDVVCKNIQRLLDLRRSQGSLKPRVELVYTALEDNLSEAADFRQEWEGKVDKVHVDPAHNWTEDRVPAEWAQNSVSPIRHPCLRLWNTFTILWNGEVSLCCLDYDGKEILGNVRQQTIKEIWQGPSLGQIRKRHIEGKFQKLGICRDCSKTRYFS